MRGECIEARDDGGHPRFLHSTARSGIAKGKDEPADHRRAGVQNFRKLNQDVTVLSRLQLSDQALERLGQRPSGGPPPPEPESEPDVEFYTGWNVLKTPHIPLLCLHILEALGVSYGLMGGPPHC